jgi:hypothetical protein
MSSVLHPVGPEPSPTYWVRRALVVAAAVLVVAIVIALIVNGTSSGSAVQPNPSPPVAQTVPADTPSPSPMGSTMRTPSALSSESASAESTATGFASTAPSATAKSKSTGSATPTAKPSPSATKTTSPGPTTCPGSSLRPTLTGKQRLKPKQPNTFALSLINGSGQTCIVTVNSKNFELKIYSGRDRIWSTNDCAAAVKPITRKLAREQAVAWAMTWDGRRSRAACKTRPEIPRSGTYFATAQLDGTKPVQLRMILHR